MRINPRLELVVLGILWGISYLLIAVGLQSFSPAQVVVVRLASGSAILAVAVAADPEARKSLSAWRSFIKYLPIQALTASAVPFFLIILG